MKIRKSHILIANFLTALTVIITALMFISVVLCLISCTPVAYSRDNRNYPPYLSGKNDFDPPTTSSRELMDQAYHYCRNSTNRNCVMDRVYYVCQKDHKIEASVCKQARRVTKNVTSVHKNPFSKLLKIAAGIF